MPPDEDPSGDRQREGKAVLAVEHDALLGAAQRRRRLVVKRDFPRGWLPDFASDGRDLRLAEWRTLSDDTSANRRIWVPSSVALQSLEDDQIVLQHRVDMIARRDDVVVHSVADEVVAERNAHMVVDIEDLVGVANPAQ